MAGRRMRAARGREMGLQDGPSQPRIRVGRATRSGACDEKNTGKDTKPGRYVTPSLLATRPHLFSSHDPPRHVTTPLLVT